MISWPFHLSSSSVSKGSRLRTKPLSLISSEPSSSSNLCLWFHSLSFHVYMLHSTKFMNEWREKKNYFRIKKLIAKRSRNNFAAQPCGKIDTPLNGTMNCSGLVTDTSCSFSCDPGYDLVGSQFRTCLPFSRWSGNLTFCKGNCYYLFIELSADRHLRSFYYPSNWNHHIRVISSVSAIYSFFGKVD